MRILADIDFHEISSPIEQAATILTEMPQMKPFSQRLISLGKIIDRLKSRLVVDPAEVEVDHDLLRIILRGEEIAKPRHRSEEENTVQLVDLLIRLVDRNVRDEMLALVPREDQRRQRHAKNHRGGKIVHDDRVNRDHEHDEHLGEWNPSPGLKGRPLEGADHHHEHHPDQCRHRHRFDPGRKKEDEKE